jgi:hypothetical protein
VRAQQCLEWHGATVELDVGLGDPLHPAEAHDVLDRARTAVHGQAQHGAGGVEPFEEVGNGFGIDDDVPASASISAR